jgi:FSR family fosmidomycin resistance protein-like MFS transporter
MNFRALFALASAHFLGDSYASFLAPLLPALIIRHGLDLKQAGLLVAVLSTAGHLMQPAWGFLADRWPGRRFAIAGPLLMAICISTIGLAPSLGMLVLALAVGGSGMAAFHPEAASLARKSSGSRPALGMSLFISGGNLGFALGPVVVTSLVAAFGLGGTIWGIIPGVVGSLILLKLVPAPPKTVESEPTASEAISAPPFSRTMRPLVNLWAISVLRGLVTVSFLTFLPILFASRGLSLTIGGRLVALFLLAGAIGGVLGGFAAERFGSKRMMGTTLALATPVLLVAVWTSGVIQGAALLLGGVLLVASHPVNVSFAQSLAPHRAGTAAAFMIGVAMGVSGLLMPVVGAAADVYGVEVGLSVMALGPFFGSILVLPLPTAVSRKASVSALS